MRASPSFGFAPRLPTAISRLAFRVCWRGRHLSITVTADSATYELLDGPPLTMTHHGAPVELGERSVALAIPPIAPTPTPTQPPGRSPARRVTAQPFPARAPGRDGRPASGR